MATPPTALAGGMGGHEGESLLSPLLGSVATSKTIEIHAMTKAMEARGEAVVSLCVGEPDFPPPKGTWLWWKAWIMLSFFVFHPSIHPISIQFNIPQR